MAHFCPNCGSAVQDDTAFCPNCGMALNQHQPTAAPTQPTGNPVQPYGTPVPSNPNQPIGAPALPMNWFKFLIYFALFAGAVLNCISGINLLAGNNLEKDIYLLAPELKTIDLFYGIVVLIMAALAIYTRFQLSAYRAKGPKLLTLLYVINFVSALVYTVTSYICVESNPFLEFEESALSSTFSSMAVCVVMIFVNKSYFKKRASLFVK